MKYLLAIFLAFSCCHPSFALTADQLAQFLSITSWESEVALPAGSFNIEVLEITDGKIGKAVTPVYGGPEAADQTPSPTGNTPILIMCKPSEHGLFLTATMGLQTRPGTPSACPNFNGPFGSIGIPKTLKEGDYILGGEPVRSPDGIYHVTSDIKDFKRGLLLRVSKKA